MAHKTDRERIIDLEHDVSKLSEKVDIIILKLPAYDEFIEGVNHTGLIDIEMFNLSESNEFNSINDGLFPLDIDGTPFFRGGCLRADPDAVINLVLPSPASAFGGDFYSANSVDGLWLQVNGSQHKLGDEMDSDDGTGFLGFISTNVFTTVTLFDPVKNDFANSVYRLGESFGLDNVSFAEVPEPMTMALMGLGGFLLRKRRKV